MRTGWTRVALLGFGLAGCLTLSACAGHNSEADREKMEEANEVTVPMDQVPAPVKDTIARESGGAAVASADKENKKGQDVYEADAMIGGKNYEIKVLADGTLLSKKLDNEDAEKNGAEEKDEKKEKDKD